MHRPVKYVEKGLSLAANGAWVVFNTLNKIKQNPAFTPRVGEDPSDQFARANAALQDVNRHLPPATDPKHNQVLLQVLNLTTKFGGEAEIAAKLSDEEVRRLAGEGQFQRWPQRKAELQKLTAETETLQAKRYDPEARKRLRAVAAEGFGLFGQMGVLQSQAAYLDNDGNVTPTAETLFTHRHTVRYRLERVRELCGHDLSSTEGREKLGLGLKAIRVLGIQPPGGPAKEGRGKADKPSRKRE